MLADHLTSPEDHKKVTDLINEHQTSLQHHNEEAAVIKDLVEFCGAGTPSQHDIQKKLANTNGNFNEHMCHAFYEEMHKAGHSSENRLCALQALLAHLHGTPTYDKVQKVFGKTVEGLTQRVAEKAAKDASNAAFKSLQDLCLNKAASSQEDFKAILENPAITLTDKMCVAFANRTIKKAPHHNVLHGLHAMLAHMQLKNSEELDATKTKLAPVFNFLQKKIDQEASNKAA